MKELYEESNAICQALNEAFKIKNDTSLSDEVRIKKLNEILEQFS